MSATDVFAAKGVDITGEVTTYRAHIRFRDKLVGGVPSSASVIRGWLQARLDVKDAALDELVAITLKERFGNEMPAPNLVIDELMKQPDVISVNGFKRNDNEELCLESRCIKAALREWSNSSFPGTDWEGKGKGTSLAKGVAARKGLMSTLEERVFVMGQLVSTGVKASEVSKVPDVGPAWIEERVKHVNTPLGPKSAIARVEVIYQPEMTFVLKVHDDFLTLQAWGRLLQRGEDIGLGADRGRSDGQFDLLEFEKIDQGIERLRSTSEYATYGT